MSFLVLGLAAREPVAVDDGSPHRHQLPRLRRADERAGRQHRGGVSGPLVIAIDGPAAAGKGTLARRLAAHFGLPHLDTGLLYRAVGWAAERTGRPPGRAAPPRLAGRRSRRPDLRTDAGRTGRLAGGRDPGGAHQPLEFPAGIRISRRPGAVLDGRDIGTVICPDAPVKLFVTASPRGAGRTAVPGVARTGGRHYKTARSCRDGGAGPSRQRTGGCTSEAAPDAYLLDTSDMDADAAFAAALAFIARKGFRSAGP